jgi:hypothetical protein
MPKVPKYIYLLQVLASNCLHATKHTDDGMCLTTGCKMIRFTTKSGNPFSNNTNIVRPHFEG